MENPLSLVEYDFLNHLMDEVYSVATDHGFHTEEQESMGMSRYTSNLHGEVSELWEAYRDHMLGEPCNKADEMIAVGLPVLTCAEEELADIIIRALDTAKVLGVDMARALYLKNAFNKTRPYKHGDKAA